MKEQMAAKRHEMDYHCFRSRFDWLGTIGGSVA